MFEELGEAIAIIKRKGDSAIMKDPTVRQQYVEELSDALMFFTDMLNCYQISADELSGAFTKKYANKMERNSEKEHAEVEYCFSPDNLTMYLSNSLTVFSRRDLVFDESLVLLLTDRRKKRVPIQWS